MAAKVRQIRGARPQQSPGVGTALMRVRSAPPTARRQGVPRSGTRMSQASQAGRTRLRTTAPQHGYPQPPQQAIPRGIRQKVTDSSGITAEGLSAAGISGTRTPDPKAPAGLPAAAQPLAPAQETAPGLRGARQQGGVAVAIARPRRPPPQSRSRGARLWRASSKASASSIQAQSQDPEDLLACSACPILFGIGLDDIQGICHGRAQL